jgi:hypothetical protein
MAIQGIAQVPQAYRNRGFAHQSPQQGRHATISPDIFTGGKPNPAGAGTLASRQIISPDVVGTSDEDMQDAVSRETQQVIPNQTSAPTFKIGNEANGHIGIGDILSSRANPTFDPTKAIGGDNVPMKPTSGLGGWFRSAFGDKANEQNLAAQQAQGQQWANDAKENKAEASAMARENRVFDRQKELRGLDSADAKAHDAALYARQDAQIADSQATRAAERMGDEVQRKLDAEVATDRFNRTLAAHEAGKPLNAFKPGEVYKGETVGKPAGSMWEFAPTTLGGPLSLKEIGGKPAFTPPPKGSAPDAAAMGQGARVEGVLTPAVDYTLGGLREAVKTPYDAAKSGAANLFGGYLPENPTLGAQILTSPIESAKAGIGNLKTLAQFADQGDGSFDWKAEPSGAPATPRQGNMSGEEYKKMLMQLRSMYPTR